MWKFNDFWVETNIFFNLCSELLWSCKELLWRQWSMYIPTFASWIFSEMCLAERREAPLNWLMQEAVCSVWNQKAQRWCRVDCVWSTPDPGVLMVFLVAGFLSHCSHVSWWHPSPFRGWSVQHRSRNAHGLCLWLPFWGTSMLTAFLLSSIC